MNRAIYICLGSNMGNKLEHCRNGVQLLIQSGTVVVKQESPLYYSEPTDFYHQDWFMNGVIEIESHLTPHRLLNILKSIEKQEGRSEDSIRFGPRVLDMDIILYDNLVLHDADLIIPHPRMHQRRFVLQPLCDLNPSLIHPELKLPVQSLLDQLNPNEQRILRVT